MVIKSIPVISAAFDIGANTRGAAKGPETLRQLPFFDALQFDWLAEVAIPALPLTGIKTLPHIAKACEKLAKQAEQCVLQNDFFLSFGGEHSCAAGVWSGVSHALLQKQQTMGLLWIDAHMDAHTPQTSETSNVHGMPLAALMGRGDPRLTEISNPYRKIHPKNICVIGARSYERGEQRLLQELGVKVFYHDEVRNRGMAAVMKEAVQVIANDVDCYGVTLDLDAFDPSVAPAVGCQASSGLFQHEVMKVLDYLDYQNLLGFEIVEYNPVVADCAARSQTESLVIDLVTKVLSKR